MMFQAPLSLKEEKMKKRIFLLGLILAFSFVLRAKAANEYWQSLDGPYWANGIDVAYGTSDANHEWYRYLIGNNGSETNLFHWWPEHTGWQIDNPILANKIITYKLDGYGQIAFLSAYGDRIYETVNGGGQWDQVRNSDQLPNKHFSSIEVPATDDNAGNVVMVATHAVQGVPSTYYTEDGSTWNPIGANSTIGWEVYDIEAFPEESYPPRMSIGTSQGIYVRDNNWNNAWIHKTYFTGAVPVLESVLRGDDGRQVAAFEEGLDGRCNLYNSAGGVNYVWNTPSEILVYGNSFDRKVKDLSASYWPQGRIALFAATNEGLFLITYNSEYPSQATSIDLKYAPLNYDIDIQAIDNRYLDLPDGVDTLYTLVASNYNVYEVKLTWEKPDSEEPEPIVTEQVKGTYLCNVNAVSFPSNLLGRQTSALRHPGPNRGSAAPWTNKGWHASRSPFDSGKHAH
jgi:hypothetical protein